jgi:hypothetical protein
MPEIETDISDSPKKFLNEVVLKTDDGLLWLSSRIAISRSLRATRAMALDICPKIWFVTGIFTMDDAKSYHIRSKDSNHALGGYAPLDALGISTLLQINPGARIETSSGHEVQAGNQVFGTKVWAAQFERLDVKYITRRTGEPILLGEVSLLNIHSSSTYRSTEHDSVIVTAAEHSDKDEAECASLSTDPQNAALDESYWMEFLQELELVKEQM